MKKWILIALVVVVALIIVILALKGLKKDDNIENENTEEILSGNDEVDENPVDNEYQEFTEHKETETPLNKEKTETLDELQAAEYREISQNTASKPDNGAAIYKVQVLALPNRENVLLQQELMQKKGIPTEISSTLKDGDTWWRLRLSGKYTKKEAEIIGEGIKKDFTSIKSYWIVPPGQ